jgi:hypothetical protein
MLRRVKSYIAAWRYRRLTRPYDRAIAAARKAHGNVRAAQARKSAAIHQALFFAPSQSGSSTSRGH